MNKSEENDLNDAPPLVTLSNEIEMNELYYNCSECSSMIEILSLEEEKNIIEFKCLNNDKDNINHDKIIMPLKDYLKNMKRYNNKAANDDICSIHNSKYISFCISCKKNLCIECLKKRNHINHVKNNIVEMQPTKLELNIIEEVIKYYGMKIEKLKEENKNKIEKIENKNNIN